jgi:hypothetical protein
MTLVTPENEAMKNLESVVPNSLKKPALFLGVTGVTGVIFSASPFGRSIQWPTV